MPFHFSKLLPWNWSSMRNDGRDDNNPANANNPVAAHNPLAANNPISTPDPTAAFAIVYGVKGCELSASIRLMLTNLFQLKISFKPLPAFWSDLKFSKETKFYFLVLNKGAEDIDILSSMPKDLFKGQKLMILREPFSGADQEPNIIAVEDEDLRKLNSYRWKCALDMLLIVNSGFAAYQVRRIYHHVDYLPLPANIEPISLVKKLDLRGHLSERQGNRDRGSKQLRKRLSGIPSVENLSESPHTPNTPQSAYSSFISDRADKFERPEIVRAQLNELEKRLTKIEQTINQILAGLETKGPMPTRLIVKPESLQTSLPKLSSKNQDRKDIPQLSSKPSDVDEGSKGKKRNR